MANTTAVAGNNGVAGTDAGGLGNAVTGAYGSTYSDNGTLAVADNCAVRRSVSRTNGTTTPSNVFSETQGLRFAYAGVEADSPALDATRV